MTIQSEILDKNKDDVLNRKQLFNKDGDDSRENQSIINGNSTGIANLNNVKHPWATQLYTKMLGNFWIPEKVNMQKDKITIELLSDAEDRTNRRTLSFLIFLDSIQINNLPNIQDFITDPAINNLLVIQQFQEVIHSQSYQYILESLYPSVERDEIYNMWREDKFLLERNSFVERQYQGLMKPVPTKTDFLKGLLANFCLEGIYFYNGFNFYDQLSYRDKLIQTSSMIDYIRNDENTHVALFLNILRSTFDVKEHRSLIEDVLSEAVEQETAWGHYVYGDDIMGISKKSTTDYMGFLGNLRLRSIGLDPIFKNEKGEYYTENPYAHLTETSKRSNFFESGAVTEYDRSESIGGWELF
jgi:ribonucleoside-diphosphate reductase beta chain